MPKKKPPRRRASEDPRVKDLAEKIALVEAIRDLVNEFGGNIARTADRLGLRRQQVWGWLMDQILPDAKTAARVKKRLDRIYSAYTYNAGKADSKNLS